MTIDTSNTLQAPVYRRRKAREAPERRGASLVATQPARAFVPWPERSRSLRRLPSAIREGAATPDVKTRDSWGRRLLALADGGAVLIALAFAVVIVGHGALGPLALLSVPAVVLAAKVSGLYERDEIVLHKSTLDEAPGLFQLATVLTLLAWLAGGRVVGHHMDGAEVVALWAGLTGSLLISRRTARLLARTVLPEERCLAIGDPASCVRIHAKLEGSHRLHAHVVGALPLVPRRGEDPARWHDGDLEDLARRFNAERLLVVPGAGENDELLDLVRAAKAMGLRVTVVPRVLEVVGTQIEFDDLAGMPVLGVRRFALSRSSRALKRALDVAGAGLGLIATAPFILPVALAIKLETRGPLFYRSTRVGRGGARFQMLKFRTMVDGAERLKAGLAGLNEADGLFKINDDPRVTRVGRLLRRSSLDELPQLINVLRGEMSLVGPRPLVEEEDDRIQGPDRRRLELTPGITGNWQILGSARIPLHEMIKIDYLYVAHWSLWSDIKILMRTVPYMLGRRGM